MLMSMTALGSPARLGDLDPHGNGSSITGLKSWLFFGDGVCMHYLDFTGVKCDSRSLNLLGFLIYPIELSNASSACLAN